MDFVKSCLCGMPITNPSEVTALFEQKMKDPDFWNLGFFDERQYCLNCLCGAMEAESNKLSARLEEINGRNIEAYIKNNIFYKFPGCHQAKLTDFSDTVQHRANDLLTNGGDLLITGDTGVGKSYLGCAIAMHYMRQPFKTEVPFENRIFECKKVNLMVREVKDTFSDSNQTETTQGDLFKRWSEQPRLFMDDFGAFNKTAFTLELLQDLLDARCGAVEKTTIFTTNLSLTEISNLFGDRIASRIASSRLKLTLSGEDMRIKKVISQQSVV